MQLLHGESHLVCSRVLFLHDFDLFVWKASSASGAEQKVASDHSVDVSEVGQDGEARSLVLIWQVRQDVIIRIDSVRLSPDLIERVAFLRSSRCLCTRQEDTTLLPYDVLFVLSVFLGLVKLFEDLGHLEHRRCWRSRELSF